MTEKIGVMNSGRGAPTIWAAALLRGDLPDLRAEAFRDLDALVSDAMADPDPDRAVDRIRYLLVQEPDLGARLRWFERRLRSGVMPSVGADGSRGVFVPPAGEADAVSYTIWACPCEPLGHFRKLQRVANQNMGVCTKHLTILVREDSEL